MNVQLEPKDFAAVYSVTSPDATQHSVWRNRLGEIVTQCNIMAVSATGYVRPNWEAAYPGNPAGGGFRCRKCARAM